MTMKAGLLITAQDAASGTLNRIAGTLDSINSKMGQTAQNSARTAAHLSEAAVAAGKVAAFARRAVEVPTQAFEDFEHEMLRVKGLMNLNNEEFRKAYNEAKRLGSELGEFKALDAAKGFAELGMAGRDLGQSMKALPSSLNLSTAAQVPLAESIAITTGIMGQYGFGAEKTAYVTDVLTSTFTNSKTTLRKLGESFGYVGKVAKDHNINFEEMALMIGALGDTSIDSTRAGTAMKSMILLLSGAARGPGRKALKSLGIALTEVGEGGKVVRRNMFDILRDLRAKLSKLNPEMQTMVKARIFGREAITGVSVVMGALDTEKFDKLAKAIKNNKDRTKELATMQRTSAKSGAMEMSSAIEGLYLTLGESLAPVLGTVRDGVTSLAISATKVAQAFPTFSRVVMVAVGAIAVLATTLTGALLALSTFSSGVAVVATMMGFKGVTAAVVMTKALVALKGGLIATKTVLVGFGAASWAAAGPIAIVVAAIGAVVTAGVLLYRYWDPIHRWFAGAFERWKTASLGAKIAIGAVATVVAVLAGPVGQAVYGIVNAIKEFEKWQESGYKLDSTLTSMVTTVTRWGDELSHQVGLVADKITGLMATVKDFATNKYVQMAWSAISGVTGIAAAQTLGGIIQTGVGAATTAAGGVVSEVIDVARAGNAAAAGRGGRLDVRLQMDENTGQVKIAKVDQSGDVDLNIDAGMGMSMLPAGL